MPKNKIHEVEVLAIGLTQAISGNVNLDICGPTHHQGPSELLHDLCNLGDEKIIVKASRAEHLKIINSIVVPGEFIANEKYEVIKKNYEMLVKQAEEAESSGVFSSVYYEDRNLYVDHKEGYAFARFQGASTTYTVVGFSNITKEDGIEHLVSYHDHYLAIEENETTKIYSMESRGVKHTRFFFAYFAPDRELFSDKVGDSVVKPLCLHPLKTSGTEEERKTAINWITKKLSEGAYSTVFVRNHEPVLYFADSPSKKHECIIHCRSDEEVRVSWSNGDDKLVCFYADATPWKEAVDILRAEKNEVNSLSKTNAHHWFFPPKTWNFEFSSIESVARKEGSKIYSAVLSAKKTDGSNDRAYAVFSADLHRFYLFPEFKRGHQARVAVESLDRKINPEMWREVIDGLRNLANDNEVVKQLLEEIDALTLKLEKEEQQKEQEKEEQQKEQELQRLQAIEVETETTAEESSTTKPINLAALSTNPAPRFTNPVVVNPEVEKLVVLPEVEEAVVCPETNLKQQVRSKVEATWMSRPVTFSIGVFMTLAFGLWCSQQSLLVQPTKTPVPVVLSGRSNKQDKRKTNQEIQTRA